MKKFTIGFVASLILATPVVNAQGISVDELRDLPEAQNMFKSENSTTINSNHWSYKTLESISTKYGLVVGNPTEKFNINKPLTRNEAAVILVSLMGKINQDRIELTDSEKERMDILKQEFGQEMAALTGRVAVLESDVKSLKGTVAKVEQSNGKTVKFANGETLSLGGGFQGKYANVLRSGSTSYAPNFGIPVGILWAKGKMAKNVDYNLQILPSRFYDNTTNNTFMGDAYVSTDIIPNNRIFFGQTRVPFGVDAPTVEFYMDTVDRSQIARNYSVRRDMGVRVDAKYKYLDYRLAAYNGARAKSEDTNNNMDTIGWINLKPLADHPKLGKLDLGSGYAKGFTNCNKYNMIGAYAGYKIGKIGLKYETAYSDGGYGPGSIVTSNYAGIKSGGYYTTATYDLTKKLQLVGKVDVFDPNREVSSNNINEYTLGTNYFINGDNLKVQLNYVFVKNQAGTNGSRIVAQTQYIF